MVLIILGYIFYRDHHGKICVKEFIKVSATHCQPRLPHAPSDARSLGNQGSVKLREDTLKRTRSVWRFVTVPARYVLGKASIVPVSQMNGKDREAHEYH